MVAEAATAAAAAAAVVLSEYVGIFESEVLLWAADTASRLGVDVVESTALEQQGNLDDGEDVSLDVEILV